MRIIAGTARGRTLKSPKGDAIRPTLDRVREALFSMLYSVFGSDIDGEVADLCAGTGALGIEALSRGAAFCTFIDSSTAAIKLIEENLRVAACADRAKLIQRSLPLSTAQLQSLLPRPPQALFCDPPYESAHPERNLIHPVLESLGAASLLAPDGVCIAQVGKNLPLQEQYGSLALLKQRTYGETAIYLYQQVEKG